MSPRRLHRQKGTATVEFALTAPLLVLLMLAVTELGWAFNQYITLIKAVRDGSRYAAANALSASQGIIELTPDLIEQTRKLVVFGQPNGTAPLLPGWSTEKVSITTYGSDHIQVSASYDYSPIVTSIISFIGSDKMKVEFDMRTATVVRPL